MSTEGSPGGLTEAVEQSDGDSTCSTLPSLSLRGGVGNCCAEAADALGACRQLVRRVARRHSTACEHSTESPPASAATPTYRRNTGFACSLRESVASSRPTYADPPRSPMPLALLYDECFRSMPAPHRPRLPLSRSLRGAYVLLKNITPGARPPAPVRVPSTATPRSHSSGNDRTSASRPAGHPCGGGNTSDAASSKDPTGRPARVISDTSIVGGATDAVVAAAPPPLDGDVEDGGGARTIAAQSATPLHRTHSESSSETSLSLSASPQRTRTTSPEQPPSMDASGWNTNVEKRRLPGGYASPSSAAAAAGMLCALRSGDDRVELRDGCCSSFGGGDDGVGPCPCPSAGDVDDRSRWWCWWWWCCCCCNGFACSAKPS
eukprot:Rhum_TRINITY_DN14082_c26_g1::Rhum_TRINITY_DN14082_c26_g1_i1::g.67197::m.67197